MGLFNKKEKIPELPSITEMPAFPDVPRKELNELPSFPYDVKDNLNQEMVKSAVSDASEDREVTVEELPRDFSFDGGIPSVPSEERKTMEIPLSEPMGTTKQIEPIFVRIDKFQAAQKDFEDVKKKIGEIEGVLKSVKEIKVKEDVEISAWSSDIENLKTKLSEIDENIFSKL